MNPSRELQREERRVKSARYRSALSHRAELPHTLHATAIHFRRALANITATCHALAAAASAMRIGAVAVCACGENRSC